MAPSFAGRALALGRLVVGTHATDQGDDDMRQTEARRTEPPPELFDPEFFPTPRPVINKMLDRIDHGARYFLEPSAGRGDIAEAVKDHLEGYGWNRRAVEVDCIEQSPELCAILQGKELPVVGTDWLTYEGVSYYDAVVMNPPFATGARHLLRAWDFLHSGEIVCLLNSETLRNPHTAERKRLAAIIEEHGDTEELGACFNSANRPTDVEITMVYMSKAAVDDRVELWETGTDEQPLGDLLEDSNLPAVQDRLGNMQRFYDEGNRHMLLAFEHARKAATYLDANKITVGQTYSDILGHAMSTNVSHNRAEFLRAHRRDAWLSVFHMMDFHKWLDRKQTDELIADVSRHGHFPFTAENIKGTLENVIAQRRKLFEQSAWNVFEALTKYYKGNTNYHEGWKSNDAFKINKKIVFPYGVRYEKKFGGFSANCYGRDFDIYNDLDRVLAVLDGERFEDTHCVGEVMQRAIDRDRHTPQAVESTYFEIRYYKKGTVHLKWKRIDLLEKFALTAARGRKWIGDDRGHQTPGLF